MTIQEENANQIKTMRTNFRRLRKKNGWSVQDLSDISGIDIKILTAIEGDADFDIGRLFTLCRIYGVNPYEIFLPINGM